MQLKSLSFFQISCFIRQYFSLFIAEKIFFIDNPLTTFVDKLIVISTICPVSVWCYVNVFCKTFSQKLLFGKNFHFTIFRSEEHTSELQSRPHLVCRLLLEKKKKHTII